MSLSSIKNLDVSLVIVRHNIQIFIIVYIFEIELRDMREIIWSSALFVIAGIGI